MSNLTDQFSEFIETLKANTLLKNCLDNTRNYLFEQSVVKNYVKCETILANGSLTSNICILLQGSLEFSSLSLTGKRYIRWYLSAGQEFGLIPAIDGKESIYDVKAHQDSKVLLIPVTAFFKALEMDSQLNLALIRNLCTRSRLLHEAAIAEALLPLKAKVAWTLLLLVKTHGTVLASEQIEISLKLSQELLADMLAVARQHVNKILKELESDHVIHLSYSTIVIMDEPQLRAIASQNDE